MIRKNIVLGLSIFFIVILIFIIYFYSANIKKNKIHQDNINIDVPASAVSSNSGVINDYPLTGNEVDTGSIYIFRAAVLANDIGVCENIKDYYMLIGCKNLFHSDQMNFVKHQLSGTNSVNQLYYYLGNILVDSKYCDLMSGENISDKKNKDTCFSNNQKNIGFIKTVKACSKSLTTKACDSVGQSLKSSCIQSCNSMNDFASLIPQIQKTKDISLCNNVKDKNSKESCIKYFEDYSQNYDNIGLALKNNDISYCRNFKSLYFSTNCLVYNNVFNNS